MWMVAAIYQRTHSASQLAWSDGWRPPGAQSAFIKWTGWTLAVTMVMRTAPLTLSLIIIIYYYYYYNMVVVTVPELPPVSTVVGRCDVAAKHVKPPLVRDERERQESDLCQRHLHQKINVLLWSVDNQNIIGFIKDAHSITNCSTCYVINILF